MLVLKVPKSEKPVCMIHLLAVIIFTSDKRVHGFG